MNQHKDLLYRQKYATYQFNNRTFSTQNTKISARSLAISYICFQVRIAKKGGLKAILSTTTENLVTPAPPTPNKGSIRKIATGKITLPITPDEHLEGLCLLKTRELPGGSAPGPPAGALWRPLDPTRMRRIACFRHTHTQVDCSQSFIIAFSRVSGRYVKHFSDAKVHKFWLARYHFSQVSCVLVSIINKTISRVLRTQSCTYCTDKQ